MNESGKITLNYVSPDARFRGVSRELVLHVEGNARTLGFEECQLETTQTALGFYKKLGYAVSERSYALPLTGTPATVLTKRLVPPGRDADRAPCE
jgi:GNAT superfamily N-acetyltransferase